MSASGYHVSNGPSYMKGAVFWEANKPLTFEDFEMPRPKANEVLVKTKGDSLFPFLFVVLYALKLVPFCILAGNILN